MQTVLRPGLVSNTLANVGGRSISLALQLALVAVLVRGLGTEAYGLLVLGLGLVGSSNLLEGAFGQAVTRHIAHYDARMDRRAVAEIVALHFFLTLGQIALFGLAFLAIERFWLSIVFTIPGGLESLAHQVVRLCIAVMTFDLLSMFLLRVAEGFQNFAGARLLEVGKHVLRFVAVLSVLAAGGGVVQVAVAHLAASVAMALAAAAYLGSRGYLHLAWPRSWRRSAEVGRFSVPIFLHKVVAFLGNRADVFIVGHFLGTTALAHYQVAFKFYEIFGQGLSMLTVATMPYAAQLSSRGDVEAAGRLFIVSARLLPRLVAPLILAATAFTSPLIQAWIGAAPPETATAAQLYLAGILFLALPGAAAHIMLGLGRWRELLVWQAMGSVGSVVLSLILVPVLHLPGAALGSLVGAAIIGVSYWIVTARSLVGNSQASPVVLVAHQLLPVSVCMLAAGIADKSGMVARAVVSTLIVVLAVWWWSRVEARQHVSAMLYGLAWPSPVSKGPLMLGINGGVEREL